MKKVIFLDVDGTISSAKTGISDKVKEAIHIARQNGHYVFICTGRNKSGVRHIDSNMVDGFICSAGGYIEINNEVKYIEYLSDEEVKEIREAIEYFDGYYNIEGTHVTYAHKDLHKYFILSTVDHISSNSELERLIENMKGEFSPEPLSAFDASPVPVHKICFILKDQLHLHSIHKKFDDRFHVVIHSSNNKHIINGEFIKRTLNKGKAIEKVISLLDLSLEDTIGFGDSMNDYEMLETCHIGVAMGNASEELKQYADIICESIDDDGVYHEFARLGLLDE